MPKPENIIIEVVVGSRAHGLDTPQSDLDTKGVCLASLEVYLGLHQFEHWTDSGGKHTVYELKKFLRLAIQCNPNIMEMFYADEGVDASETGQAILESRDLFLSKHTVNSYCGYARGMLNKAYAETQRDKKGKKLAHALRIIKNGFELIRYQTMIVNRKGIDHAGLMDIRNGKCDFDEVTHTCELLLGKMRDYPHHLPDEPGTKQINSLCMEILKDYIVNGRVS